MSLRWMSHSNIVEWHDDFEIRNDGSVLKVPCPSPYAEKLVGFFLRVDVMMRRDFQNRRFGSSCAMLMSIASHFFLDLSTNWIRKLRPNQVKKKSHTYLTHKYLVHCTPVLCAFYSLTFSDERATS